MRSLNRCEFLGNVGNDPELRYMPSGEAVVKISLACNESYKDKSGKRVERVEWVRLVAFGKRAEVIGEYIKKGSRAYFSGRMKTSSYESKDGVKMYSTEVVVDDLLMLDSKDSKPGGASDYPAAGQGPGRQHRSSEQIDTFDDDIPF